MAAVTEIFSTTMEDFSNTSMNNTYTRPFGNVGTIVSAFIIFLFLVIGLVGNSVTIAVINKYKELRTNVFMNFILSLCVSDLISALISWLFLYRRTWGFDDWSPIPDFLCKFYWSADLMTSFVTALHILSFAILRLISLRFPHTYNKFRNVYGKIWIASIWIVCFFVGFVRTWFLYGPGKPNRNSNEKNARWPVCTVLVDKLLEYNFFQATAYAFFLCAPILGIVIICFYIIYLVKNREKERNDATMAKKKHRKEKQAVVQLILIIVAFLIGYVPFLAYEFWSVQEYPDEIYYHRADYWFGMIEYFFLRFSECLNPFFYNLGSAKMRKYTKKFLKIDSISCRSWRQQTRKSSSDSASSTNITNFGV